MLRSQRLHAPILVALGIVRKCLTLFPQIIRYILSVFDPQCQILPTQYVPYQTQVHSPEELLAGHGNSLNSSNSHEECSLYESHIPSPQPRENREPKIMSEESSASSTTDLQLSTESSYDHTFNPFTEELLFGNQQFEYKQAGKSGFKEDLDVGTPEMAKSSSGENSAQSLQSLVNRLETSARADTDDNMRMKNKMNLKKTRSSEPCNAIKSAESFSRRNTATINLRNCKLKIIKDVVRKLGMKGTVDITRDWDVLWTSNPISVVRCKTFMKHQRTNHFPESSNPLLKNNLAKYLTRMSSKYPKEYNFFPETWCLPEASRLLMAHARKHPDEWYIVKPNNCSSGHGIFITRDLRELANCGRMVCQVYIQRPLLIDGYKFDLRIYVLVTSCKPLRIFVYNEGFARLCTELYQAPNRRNEKNRRMHLTNYSVNKCSSKCIIDDRKGTLRKLSTFNEWLTENKIEEKTLTGSIDDAIIKTTIAIAPVLSRYYYMSFPDQTESNSCFQIFGFDVMIDENYKPYVLEVNTEPSLYADIRMERELKEELVSDTFNILNLTKKPKKTFWLTGTKSQGAKRIDDKKLTQSRIEWEDLHRGKYRKVYPNDNMAYYEEFLKAAEHISFSV